jgi:hypothetical protein
VTGLGISHAPRDRAASPHPEEVDHMNVPATLLLQTVPFATIILVSETDEERQQLLLVVYVSLLGLFLSLFAIIDDARSWTSLFNIMVESADSF